jgi:hypothetical protein
VGLVRIAFRIEFAGADTYMAEDWIEKLATGLASANADVSRKIGRRDQDKAIIAKEAPQFFKTFGEFIKTYGDEMDDALRSRDKNSPHKCKIEASSVTLRREKLPHVILQAAVSAVPTMTISALTVNPEVSSNGSQQLKSIQCRFEVSEANGMFAVIDGENFHNGKDAARYIIERLFPIPLPA